MSSESAEDEEMRCSSDQSLSEQSQSAEESFQIQFQQIYLIARHYLRTSFPEYSIYKIDVSSSSSSSSSNIQSLEPIITLEEDDILDSGFAVLGHTLYAFGGMDPDSQSWRNDMRFYDMKEADSFAGKIHFPVSRMSKGKNYMKGRKFKPQAILVDETRICVFSLLLFDKQRFPLVPDSFMPPNFELFDTISETWIELPEPKKYDTDDAKDFPSTAFIISYFTSHKTLTIYTSIGIYQMKFDVPHPSWAEMLSIPNLLDFPFPGILINKDQHPKLVLGPFFSNKWEKFARPSCIKLKAEGWRKRVANGCCGSGGLCLRDGLVFFVRVVFEDMWPSIDSVPHLLVDIVKNDSEFASCLSESKEIEAVRSFTFSLNSLRGNRIPMVQCFPLKDADMIHC